MPTKRTRQSRGHRGVITHHILERYRRLYELEHSGLPDSAPEQMAHGEIDQLSFGIVSHFGLKPWSPYGDFEALGDRLAAAAGLPRRGDNAYKLV
jgi:hypothetical protein